MSRVVGVEELAQRVTHLRYRIRRRGGAPSPWS
jgi:hypothetical protein